MDIRLAWLAASFFLTALLGEARPHVTPIVALPRGASYWTAVADDNGRWLVGGLDLRRYDGFEWTVHQPGNQPGLRVILPDGGRIWAGTMHGPGFFEEAADGRLRWTSFNPDLHKAGIPVEEIWHGSVQGEFLVFATDNGVLAVHRQTLQPHYWALPNSTHLIGFSHLDRYYFSCEGLWEWTPQGPVAVGGNPPPYIYGAIDRPGGRALAVTFQNGLFDWNSNGEFSPAMRDDQNLWKEAGPLAVCALGDGRQAIGTFRRGVYIVDGEARLTAVIDRPSGVPDFCLGLAMDADRGLWILANGGVGRWTTSPTVEIFEEKEGLGPERLYQLSATGGEVFACGDFGLKAWTASRGFSQWPTPERPLTSLCRVEGQWYGTGFGVCRVSPEGTVPLLSSSSTYYILKPVEGVPGGWVAGSAEGFHLLTAKPDGTVWEVTATVATPGLSVEQIVEDPNGGWWASGLQGWRWKIDRSDHGQLTGRLHGQTGREPRNPPLFRLGDGIFSATDAGVEKWDGRNWRMEMEGLVLTAAAEPDPQGRMWAVERRPNGTHGLGCLERMKNGRWQWKSEAVPCEEWLNGRVTLTQEADGALWVGETGRIARLTGLGRDPLPRPSIFVVNMTANGERADWRNNDLCLDYSQRTLSMTCGLTRLADGEKWTFQYTAECGLTRRVQTGSRQQTFSGLREGLYRLTVTAVNQRGEEAGPLVLSFTVRPPWFRTAYAYAMYVLTGLGAVWGFVFWRTRLLRQRTRELEAIVATRTEELSRANAAKRDFLASVSHEIRNPLNGLAGLSDIIMDEALSARQRSAAEAMRACVRHLSGLLEDVLDFARIEAGRMEVHNGLVDLPGLCRELESLQKPHCQHKGLQWRMELDANLPNAVVTDGLRLRQILLNLLVNAVRYTNHGGVVFRTQTLRLTEGHAFLTFSILDTGPGLAEEARRHLFTRFNPGAPAGEGGHGLGLALCRQLAHLLNAELRLESPAGGGTLAILEASLPCQDQPASTAVDDPAGFGEGRAALVVEDQEFNRLAISHWLTKLGFAVEQAEDGQSALDLAAEVPYQLILTDWDLPDLDGITVAQRLRETKSKAVIVGCSGDATPERKAACLAAGMDAFTSKPLSLEKLARVLHPLFAGRPAPSAEGETGEVLADWQREIQTMPDWRAKLRKDAEYEWAMLTKAQEEGDHPRVRFLAHRFLTLTQSAGQADITRLLRALEKEAEAGGAHGAELWPMLSGAMDGWLKQLGSGQFDKPFEEGKSH